MVSPKPNIIRRRPIDPAALNKSQAIRRFQWNLSRNKGGGLEEAMDALIHLGCFDEALKQCMKGRRPNIDKMQALLVLWNNRGLWSIPRALADELSIFTDVLRHFVSPYTGPGLTLCRGQSRLRHENGIYGIAWTSRLEVAAQFSRLRETPGVVVKVDASPEMIVLRLPDYISSRKTDPQNEWEYEDEYIVDPRLLGGKISAVE